MTSDNEQPLDFGEAPNYETATVESALSRVLGKADRAIERRRQRRIAGAAGAAMLLFGITAALALQNNSSDNSAAHDSTTTSQTSVPGIVDSSTTSETSPSSTTTATLPKVVIAPNDLFAVINDSSDAKHPFKIGIIDSNSGKSKGVIYQSSVNMKSLSVPRARDAAYFIQNGSVYKVNADGSGLLKIVSNATDAKVSPDGTRLAYRTAGQTKIISRQLASKTEVSISYSQPDPAGQDVIAYSWTYDSRNLIVLRKESTHLDFDVMSSESNGAVPHFSSYRTDADEIDPVAISNDKMVVITGTAQSNIVEEKVPGGGWQAQAPGNLAKSAFPAGSGEISITGSRIWVLERSGGSYLIQYSDNMGPISSLSVQGQPSGVSEIA